MSKSYGFIEITGVVAAMDALDIMCKTADVELASWERKLGGRLVTIIVQGDVAAVTEAVEAAATNAIKKPASYAVIANPHEEIVKMVELSASRCVCGYRRFQSLRYCGHQEIQKEYGNCEEPDEGTYLLYTCVCI